jgi:hypothetical protein
MVPRVSRAALERGKESLIGRCVGRPVRMRPNQAAEAVAAN